MKYLILILVLFLSGCASTDHTIPITEKCIAYLPGSPPDCGVRDDGSYCREVGGVVYRCFQSSFCPESCRNPQTEEEIELCGSIDQDKDGWADCWNYYIKDP